MSLGCTGPRNRTEHEKIMVAGSSDFDRAFHMLLAVNLGKSSRIQVAALTRLLDAP